MSTTREQLQVKYPEDGHRMLDIVMDMTLKDGDFAAHVKGGEMNLVSKFVERNETGTVVREGYIIEMTFPEKESRSSVSRSWSVQREQLLVST